MNLQQLASKDLYVQNRYLMLVAKRFPSGSWIWFNGNQGQDYAVLNNQVAASYANALEQLARNNDESVESVEADYKDWYYKVPIEDVIRDYQHNINLYRYSSLSLT